MIKQRTPQIETCIEDCHDCHRICLETKAYCLEMGGEHADPKHIKALSDCLELCEMSEHFMLKESNLHGMVCGVCAEACRICAESCEMMPDDEQMKACAEICRKCEESCKAMAS